jgi:hypothetical protein
MSTVYMCVISSAQESYGRTIDVKTLMQVFIEWQLSVGVLNARLCSPYAGLVQEHRIVE